MNPCAFIFRLISNTFLDLRKKKSRIFHFCYFKICSIECKAQVKCKTQISFNSFILILILKDKVLKVVYKVSFWHSNLMNTLLNLNIVAHFSNKELRVMERTRWGKISHQVFHKENIAHCSYQALFKWNVIILLDYY